MPAYYLIKFIYYEVGRLIISYRGARSNIGVFANFRAFFRQRFINKIY